MALLLSEIEWGEPLLRPVTDPEWEAEIKRRGAQVSEADRRIAPNRWLREAGLGLVSYVPAAMPTHLFQVGAMVTAQENACRYCYGANRAYMKILGYSESFISRLEREMRVADLDDKEHGFIAFCRNLARSRPRPAKAEREALVALGYSPLQVNEMAFLIAMGCFYNRVSTLIACPPEHGFERIANGWIGRMLGLLAPLTRAMIARKQRAVRAQPPDAGALASGAFGPIVSTLAGLPAAAIFKGALDGAFESTTISRPAKALMFCIVARTLDCRHTEAAARTLLQTHGFSGSDIDSALQTLQSPKLPGHEAQLLPWVRDTVYYRTADIQAKTRALAKSLDSAVLLEAIGVAALANATVRLAMLLE
jgi:alkylhydroperoxidase family enzyme